MRNEKTIVPQRFLPIYLTICIAVDLAEISETKKGRFKFPVYINKSMMEADIENLELSVRSMNCLRRVGIHTIGALVESIETDEDLKKIRNCGKTSITEIMLSVMCYQYELLSVERRKKYIARIKELNAKIV